MIQEINKNLLIYFNYLSNNKIIEIIVKIFIDYPIFFLPLFLLFCWFYFSYIKKDNEKKKDLLFIFYSTIIAIIISIIIQQIVDINRPETVLKGVGKLLLKHIPDASFPSDHATVSFAFLTGLFFANYKKTLIIFSPFVILMNISRIIAGVHWPFDILAGIIVGIVGGILSFKIIKNIKIINNINEIILKII